MPPILFISIVSMALPSCLLSQEPGSGSRVIAVVEFPEAPQPQFALAAAEPGGHDAAAGQDQTAQHPASAATPASSTTTPGNTSSQSSDEQAGSISGTVTDVNDDIIPGAIIVLEGPDKGARRTAVADDKGAFQIGDLKPGITYRVTISAKGFINWISPDILLSPGQQLFLTDNKLKTSGLVTSVTVYSSPVQIATEQVKVEEQQRVFGIIPNFYVVYDPNPAPLTTKLKFKLALRAATDPATFVGVGFFAGIDQAAHTPNFVEGAKGYGQRYGADYTDGFTDIFIGGAILPSLLHQDPRYFYQGTGTKKSRALHAILSPFICKGDNGRLQPNISSVGGDLAAGADLEPLLSAVESRSESGLRECPYHYWRPRSRHLGTGVRPA